MSKNIVICCDGTGNEINDHISNVLKLFRIAKKDASQCVFYDPGVGTLSKSDAWEQFRNKFKGVLGLATGYGMDDNILEAYNFLIDQYQQDDRIFLFGFSRGAYTVRALAGMLELIGLLEPDQRNLCGYALTAYKQSSEHNDLSISWRFKKITSARHVPIRFLGVWDTVASVLIPRPDRLFVPSLQTLPYTRKNPSVEVFRQAIAIDERRRMFRLSPWLEPQTFVKDPFKKVDNPAQDIKQVWFAGVHSDIGGGYREIESGLSKFPLGWMIDEAANLDNGLEINKTMYNHIISGRKMKGGEYVYMGASVTAEQHDSMTVGWKALEWIPKLAKLKEWPGRSSHFGWYLPKSEPRLIPENALLHASVIERMEKTEYKPINLPGEYQVV